MIKFLTLLCSSALFLEQAVAGGNLGTQFTYQGHLRMAGAPLNNFADLEFTLWDTAIGGNQIGSVQAVNGLDVIDGLFVAELDFGIAAFNGNARWLEICVRSPAGSGAFTTLSPRQPLTATPYALQTRGLFVDADGNVAIGHPATPARLSLLDVGQTDDTPLITFSENQVNNEFNFIGDFGGSGPTGNSLRLGTLWNVNAMTWRGDGNVGIGTAMPELKLQIVGGSDAGIAGGGFLQLGDSTGLNIGIDNNEIMGRNNGVVSDLFLNNEGGNVILGAAGPGRLGIGTTAPLATLHTVGGPAFNHARIESTDELGTWFHLGNSDTDGGNWGLISTGSANSEGAGRLLIRDNTANAVRMQFEPAGDVRVNAVRFGADAQRRITFADDQTGLTFPMTSGSPAPMIHLYESNVSQQASRMVLALDPSLEDWGLRYNAPANDFEFLANGHRSITFDLNTASVGIGFNRSPEARVHVGHAEPFGGSTKIIVEADPADSNEAFQPSITMMQDGRLVTADLGFFDSTNNFSVRVNDTTTGIAHLIFEPEGNIGIGVSDPQHKLDLLHPAVGTGWGVRIRSAGNTTFAAGMRVSDDGFFDVTNNIGGANYARLNSSGAWTVVSDRRRKRDIAPLDNADMLDRALALEPVQFRYKPTDGRSTPSDLQIGFIAHDVQQQFPSLVSEGEDLLTLDYSGLSTVAIAAMQQQQTQIDELREQLDAVRAEMAALRSTQTAK